MKPTTALVRSLNIISDPPKPKEDGGAKTARAHTKTAEPSSLDKLHARNRPWAKQVLVFDTETSTDPKSGQIARIGCWRLHGLDYSERASALGDGEFYGLDDDEERAVLDEISGTDGEGVFYNPDICSAAEIKTVKAWAIAQKIKCYTADEFVRGVLFKRDWIKKYTREDEKLIVGHNLPFDIGALSTRSVLARGDMLGGFTLQLCACQKTRPVHDYEILDCAINGELDSGKTLDEIDAAHTLGGALIRYEADRASIDGRQYGVSKDQAASRANAKTLATMLVKKMNLDRSGLESALRNIPCAFHAPVKIKKLGFGKHMMSMGTVMPGRDGKTHRPPRFQFLDTMTLGRALLGPGAASLAAIGGRLKLDVKKTTADYHGPITEDYLNYCRNDVELTWEVFKALRSLYRKHDVSTPMHRIYSEASLGKAYLKDFGIKPFLPPDIVSNPDRREETETHANLIQCGKFAEAFYGGRSEVRIRHKIAEVMHADFKSQYPTVNGMMRLQELMLAERITFDNATDEFRSFLDRVTLDDLQRLDTWRALRGVACILPKNDILPVRTDYGSGSSNVGINIVTGGPASYYTFADIVASKLLTGKAPTVLSAVKMTPHGRYETKRKFIFGDEQTELNLSKDDLFLKVIELRADVQKLADACENKTSAEFAFLDSQQNALKLLANSTSYGVLLEVVEDLRNEERRCDVYCGGGHRSIKANKRSISEDGGTKIDEFKGERPGRYYAPYGALIPAAGRLLLAISETLARERGLNYTFCDTDSMCFAKPEDMSRDEFRAKVLEIAGPKGWFQALNPYSTSANVVMFNLEAANFRLKDDVSGKVTGELEPLYCLGISAKRYALFNLDAGGEPIIRKASAHGLADLTIQSSYNPQSVASTAGEHVAASLNKETNRRAYGKLCNGEARFVLDIWRIAIRRMLRAGTLDGVQLELEALPILAEPKFSRAALSTADLWRTYENIPNRRPFMFFNTLPKPQPIEGYGFGRREHKGPTCFNMAERHKLLDTSFYSEYGRDELTLQHLANIKRKGVGLYRRDNGEFPIEMFYHSTYALRFTSIGDRLIGHFNRREFKSYSASGGGMLDRTRVHIFQKNYVGKEMNVGDDDEDIPDDDKIASSLAITCGDVVDWSPYIPYLDQISKVAGVPVSILRNAAQRRKRLRDPAHMRAVEQSISSDGLGNVTISAPYKPSIEVKVFAALERLYRAGKIADVAAHMGVEEMRVLDVLNRRSERAHLDRSKLYAAAQEVGGVNKAAAKKAERRVKNTTALNALRERVGQDKLRENKKRHASKTRAAPIGDKAVEFFARPDIRAALPEIALQLLMQRAATPVALAGVLSAASDKTGAPKRQTPAEREAALRRERVSIEQAAQSAEALDPGLAAFIRGNYSADAKPASPLVAIARDDAITYPLPGGAPRKTLPDPAT